jgi:hypothetical protein
MDARRRSLHATRLLFEAARRWRINGNVTVVEART